MSFTSSGSFESGGPCPASHPVKIPQILYETVWDTRAFNDAALWPADGTQPFVWSMGDATGLGQHADYVFGWKGDALQRAMDANCNVNCPQLKSQSTAAANRCLKKPSTGETVDGCEFPRSSGSKRCGAAADLHDSVPRARGASRRQPHHVGPC